MTSPEEKRAQKRAYYARKMNDPAFREQKNARARANYARRRNSPEFNSEEKRIRDRDASRRFREENPDYHRNWRRQNLDKVREQSRRWASKNPDRSREIHRLSTRRASHGLEVESWIAQALYMQDGKCYLCKEPLGDKPNVDHDHSCCPSHYSCSFCRRGLACNRCNILIGLAEDRPELLRLIAENLEPVLMATQIRIAAKPNQQSLPDAEAS